MRLDRKEVDGFLTDAEKSSDPMRRLLAERFGIDGCYFEAIQWIQRMHGLGFARTPGLQRLPTDYTPESRKLRSIDNEVTRLTQKQAAATDPEQVYMDVAPPPRDTGPEAAFRAATHETAVNAAIDDSRYLAAAAMSNFRRYIFGTWGMGLALESDADGRTVRAFDFTPLSLILDSSCQKLDLAEHPYVIFSEIWDLDKIRRVFGVTIPPDDAKTFEQLDPQKIELNLLSQNKLFTRYANMARTKGAKVYQVHLRTDSSFFGQWYVAVENAHKVRQIVNEDDQTPFGGVGMPFTLLHAFPRSDTMWSWGVPAQLKDEQDKRNLRSTQEERIFQAYAHIKWVYDRRALGSKISEDDMQSALSNQVGNAIPYEGSDRVRNIGPPQCVPMPQPPAVIGEYLGRSSVRMVQMVHKAPGNFGETPTHVPFRTTQRVLDDADQVDSTRIRMDVRAHQYLIGVMHATTVRLVQERNPATAAMLSIEGFEAEDFAVLLQSDWRRPPVRMSVREGSFRAMSATMRKQNLDNAAQLQMIDADEYKSALADLQMPLDEESRQMNDQCNRIALRVMHGEPWAGEPMGKWNPILIKAFIRTNQSRQARTIPGAKQRLVQAIQAQYNMWYMEQRLANPDLAAQAPQGQPQAGQGEEPPQQPETASVADILNALQSGGGANVGAQPAAA